MPNGPSSSQPAGWNPHWSSLTRLVRLQNQTGTLLLLLPTLWALVLAARGLPSPRLVLIFVAGSFLMRSASVILNDLADQSFDRHVERTKTRPLASGEIGRPQAFWLCGVFLIAAGSLVLLLNPLVTLLAPVALLLAALYPFSKRMIHVPQAILGMAFGWGTIMAWAAVREQIEPPVWCLYAATIAWAIAYDTIYAIQDIEDDRRIGVKSAALFFGSFTWLAVGIACAAMLALLGAAGWTAHIGWPYYGTLCGVGLFCARQVSQLRIAPDPSRAFEMFHAHVWAGVAVLAGLLAGFLV